MAHSNNLKKLQAVWYKKLKKSGFDDIEKNEYELIEPSSIFSRTTGRSESSLTTIGKEAKRDYYMMATDFLNTYEFTSDLERIIWEYHSNGLSLKDICETLNKIRRKKVAFSKVRKTVEDLKELLKKKYLIGYK